MKAGQWPVAPECGVGVLVGGDTGESVPATAGLLSTARDGHHLVVVVGGGCGTVRAGAAGVWR